MIADRHVVRAGLRPIFQEFPEAHKTPSESISAEFLQAVKVFNPVAPAEVESHSLALLREYQADSSRKDSK